MLMNLVQWILHKIQHHLSQYHPGVQLGLCFFGALSPSRQSSNDRCPLMMQNEFLRPSSLLHRSPLFYIWLSSGSTPESVPIFPFLNHCCLCCGNFMAWGTGINLRTKLKCCSELSTFPSSWSSWWIGKDSPFRSLVDSLASKIHASFNLSHWIYHKSSHADCSCLSCKA